jgi:hypothetical protein
LTLDTAENINIVELESKKRGRKTLLGDELDSKVRIYLQTLRSKGGVVNTAICRAVGHGIVTANDKQLLSNYSNKKLGCRTIKPCELC